MNRPLLAVVSAVVAPPWADGAALLLSPDRWSGREMEGVTAGLVGSAAAAVAARMTRNERRLGSLRASGSRSAGPWPRMPLRCAQAGKQGRGWMNFDEVLPRQRRSRSFLPRTSNHALQTCCVRERNAEHECATRFCRVHQAHICGGAAPHLRRRRAPHPAVRGRDLLRLVVAYCHASRSRARSSSLRRA